MTRDRFLLGIFLGIGVLVVAALILFFARKGESGYVADSTPAGALQNYIVALQRHEYERAYSYVADSPAKPDLIHFEEPFISYQGQAVSNALIEIGETIPDAQGQTAVVQFTQLQGNQGLFENTTRAQMSASLVRQKGAWKISSIPYPFSPPEPPYPAPPKELPSLTPDVTPSPTS